MTEEIVLSLEDQLMNELNSMADLERTLTQIKFDGFDSLYITKEVLDSPTSTQKLEINYEYQPVLREEEIIGYSLVNTVLIIIDKQVI